MNVVVLPSARSLDAATAFASFVAKAKTSKAFGTVDWDSPVWEEVEVAKKLRESSGKTGAKALHFLAGKGGARNNAEPVPLERPFVDFLKAAVRLAEESRPLHVENHRVMIRAGRHLHDALAADGYEPTRLLPRHFDEAAKTSRAVETPSSAYATGKKLAELARVVDAYNIARARIAWKNTTPRPSSDDRITKEAEARRESRLPSQAALDALPQISRLVTEDMDVLRMRVIELLVCGGWRINELLTIPFDCEVEESAYKDGRQQLGDDGEPVVRYGIRYFAEKGFGPTVKWIPSAMVDVARRAVSDCRRLTDPVRSDAEWMTDNPGSVRVRGLQESDPDFLTPESLNRILGLSKSSGGSVHAWCRARNIDVIKKADGSQTVSRRAVADALVSGTPRIPKEYPIPLHRHLFLVRANALHQGRATIPGTVRLLQSGAVSDYLMGRRSSTSAFATFGFTEPDGSPIHVNTHQFRHWLNTLAHEGGLAQELVARWSGRKDMSQNAAYDHVTGRELAEHVRVLAEKGEMRGGLAQVAEKLAPIERSEFLQTQLATAHVTEIGLCIHDWSLAPCPTHGDCSNCNEHLVDKGNAEHRVEAERQLEEVRTALEIADAEAGEGTYGSSRWQDAHRRRKASLTKVVAIHRDQTIKDGTLVHLGSRQGENE